MSKSFFAKAFAWTAWFICAAVLAAACALYFSKKPDLLEEISFGSLILDKGGGILRAGLSADDKYRFRTSLEKINPFAAECLLQYEDRHFFSHFGVNPLSMLRAALSFPFAGRLAGGSTISMQLARMRFKLKTSDFAGKIRQMWLALVLERHYDKEELLEAYFNLAPYGANIEGIEAASRIYFHKSADKLTESECAALAVIPQNPVKRNPLNGKEFMKAARRLARVFNTDMPPALKASGFEELAFLAPHLALEMEKSARGGAARTGIERGLQKNLEKILTAYTQRGKKFGINNAAAIIVDSSTMLAAALAGSANFKDAGIQGQVDGTKARRSPGSALKPFIYALAIEQGLIHPMTILPDKPSAYAFYKPENFDHAFRGPVSAKEALKASRNLPAIWLSQRIRHPDLYNFLLSANVRLERAPEHYGLALALGGAEVTMRELASLYAMLVNKGVWRNLRFRIDEPLSAGKRLLSPEAAWITLSMLKEEDQRFGSGRIPLYAKTGTSNGLRDAWACGVLGKYVVAVWVGNFDNSSNPYFVGAKSAMPLLEEIAASLAHKKKMEDSLKERPENIIEASVCLNTGDLDIGQCESAEPVYFIPGKSPVQKSGVLRPIFIDKATGLRACAHKEGKTERVWWEFWPSDMRAIFARAGVNKPDPPEFMEECAAQAEEGGSGPEIKSPIKNALYQRAISDKNFQIPLSASAGYGSDLIHWYADSEYLGSSRPEETILWKPERGGEVSLLAVDNLGRSGGVKCRIVSVP